MTLTTSCVHISAALLLLLADMAVATAAESRTYEAPLPAQITTAPDLCSYVPCHEVMPGADSFSMRKGKPPYVEAYKRAGNEQQLIGYLFLSTDIGDIAGYSGKPIVTLIGMDINGVITGVKILRHAESVLHVGIPEEALTKFFSQYEGKFVGGKIEIGTSHKVEGVIGIDAISGATVTSIAANQMLLHSGIEIAKQVGIIKPAPRPQASFTHIRERLSWSAMASEGSIQRLTVSPDDVTLTGDGYFIDIYFGYLNPPALGQSILGDSGYNSLMSSLQPGEHAIFIIANGMESFKGSGFARGGIYERIQITQERDNYIFRDVDYLNLYGIEAENAPGYRESGIFIIRDSRFSSAYPWQLVFLASKIDKATGTRTFSRFAREYWLPARYIEGGRPVVERPEPEPHRIWSFMLGAGVIIILVSVILLKYNRSKKQKSANVAE